LFQLVNMQREQIITEMYNSARVRQLIGKMHPVDLQDDLLQELAIVLCKMPECELLERYNNNYLEGYCMATIGFMIQSSKSSFFFKFRSRQLKTVEFQPYHITGTGQQDFNELHLKEIACKLTDYEMQAVETYLMERHE